jgi:hypothetical protein
MRFILISILTAIAMLALALPINEAYAQSWYSEDPCELSSVSQSAAGAWRARSIENANRIRESLRIYNLNCLREIPQWEPKFGWWNFLIQFVIDKIFTRICQTIMPGIELTRADIERLLKTPEGQSLLAFSAADHGVSLC